MFILVSDCREASQQPVAKKLRQFWMQAAVNTATAGTWALIKNGWEMLHFAKALLMVLTVDMSLLPLLIVL